MGKTILRNIVVAWRGLDCEATLYTFRLKNLIHCTQFVHPRITYSLFPLTFFSLHVTRFADNSLIYRGLRTSVRVSRFHFPVTFPPLCFHSGSRPARKTAVRECESAIYEHESAVYEHELAVYERESAVLVAKRSAFRPKR